MSLRTKFLGLFISLGVLPLLALGVRSYHQSTRALEDLLAARTGAIASRAAEALAQRYTRCMSDFLYLANNAETRRLLGDRLEADLSTGDARPSEALDSIGSEARDFLDAAWRTVGTSWSWAEIRDGAGSVLHRMGEPRAETERYQGLELPASRSEYVVTRPIRGEDGESDQVIGSIRGALLMEQVLPRAELAAGFGELGYSVVVDRNEDRILFHPEVMAGRQSLSTLLGPNGWGIDPGFLGRPAGQVTYSEAGAARVASFVSLDDPPWTVISSESVDEFAAPFAQTGAVNLLIVLLVTATISGAFLVLTRGAMSSLHRLTIAADEMAAGNLEPPLPPGGGDEVGRLSAAFSVMVDQVRSMLRRVEESRHMSAIGEFAAQLSHEIRNPLTSIKLNLQRLDRGVAEAKIPQDYAKAIQLSLREAKRLDGTVRGVLSIARTRAPRRGAEPLHRIIGSALEAIAPQMEEQAVRCDTTFSAGNDTVLGDEEMLKGAFLNLFLNAVEAVDPGGLLRISTENRVTERRSGSGLHSGAVGPPPAQEILVRISDDGPGIPDEIRDRVFDPFFTTKDGGSGFGLPMAVRVMEEHSGTLTLSEPEPPGTGAAFVVVLPVVGSNAVGSESVGGKSASGEVAGSEKEPP